MAFGASTRKAVRRCGCPFHAQEFLKGIELVCEDREFKIEIHCENHCSPEA